MEAHLGETWEEGGEEMFEMKVEKTFTKPLARHNREWVELEMSRANNSLNSKSVWNNSRIPRIIIEDGDKQLGDEESGMGKVREQVRKIGNETEFKSREWGDTRKFPDKFIAKKRQNRQSLDDTEQNERNFETDLEKSGKRRKVE